MIVTIPKNVFEIKCTDCGQMASVPFKPAEGKPVYCKTCFSKHMYKRPESASKNSACDSKQVWARRRDNGQGKSAAEHHNVFQWSFSMHDKEAV